MQKYLPYKKEETREYCILIQKLGVTEIFMMKETEQAKLIISKVEQDIINFYKIIDKLR